MLERLANQLLKKYLGQYVQDLDSKKINIGILNGKIELCNLKLKTEALSQLGLPVEVKGGCIGYIKIVIPWKNLNERPIVVNVDNVLVVIGPIKNRPYDEVVDIKHEQARKRLLLSIFDSSSAISPSEFKGDKIGLLEKSLFTAVDNIQVCVTNIHVTYEDSNVFTRDPGFVFGLLLHSATIETTNHKWRSGHFDTTQPSVFKLIKLDSLSVYWNRLAGFKNHANNFANDDKWKSVLIKTLETFTINGEECQFLLKPASAKVKAIISKDKENRASKLLLDFVIHDLSTQMSYSQYVSILSFYDSLKRMEISLTYRKFYPHLPLNGNAKQWWLYAYKSTVYILQTFSWSHISLHRKNYRKYRDLYKKMLSNLSHNNIQSEVIELEDKLDVTSIILAREEAKVMLEKCEEANIETGSREAWWKSRVHGSNDEADETKENEASGLVDTFTFDRNWKNVEHNVIFTVANCSFSLLNMENQEIVVITFTQLLTNLDSLASKLRSFSLRLESFLVEGVSCDHELVPIIHADIFSSGASAAYVFALDFGARYPQNPNSDYVINIASEQFEVVYQQNILTELKSFDVLPWLCDVSNFVKLYHKLVDCGQRLLSYLAVSQNKIHLSCYLKCPTVIFPEVGSFQKDGNLLIVDFGHLTIQSVLNYKSGKSLDLPTLQNLEIFFNDVQILFVDSADEWRIGRMLPDTEFHLIPKIQAQIICSAIGKEDDKDFRKKFDIALPSFKVNLSDRRLKQLLKFSKNVSFMDIYKEKSVLTVVDHYKADRLWEPSISYLKSISSRIALEKAKPWDDSLTSVGDVNKENGHAAVRKDERVDHSLKLSKSDDSSDVKEQWARTVDFPGFDDNVSPTNFITSALCLIIGEVVIHMARSSDHVDKPYLMLRIEKLSIDVAVMVFGPALQLSTGCFQLVDKLHLGFNGQYLELLNSDAVATENVILILYRKVSSDCPDFKTHFHSVEQSLVVTIEHVKTNFHQGAIITIQKYLEYMTDGLNVGDVKKRHQSESNNQAELPGLNVKNSLLSLLSNWACDPPGPPVPPGAIKRSFSFRLDRLNVRLCDSDLQLAEFELEGYEMDFIQKANEKIVFHVYLQYFAVSDLLDSSLYSKLITPEDDKVFELKYVENCEIPGQHGICDDAPERKCDMHLKVQMRKLKICLLVKVMRGIKCFLESLLQYQMVKIRSRVEAVNKNLASLIKYGSVINLSIDIQAPLLIIPQKQDSPNAIAFQLGDIGLENFVKVTEGHEKNLYADNILARWNNLQMSRVTVMDDGSFEDAEIILEQAKIRLDIVREITQLSRDHLISISGVMDTIKINIGQRDLALLLTIYKESITVDELADNALTSSVASPPCNTTAADVIGKKLQAFFNTSVDIIKEISFHFTLEGAEIVFGDEQHNSKMSRKSATVLQLEEINVDLDMYNNGLLEIKCALQNICIEDIRQDVSFATTKILHSYGDEHKPGKNNAPVALPPIIYASYKQQQNGDVQVNFVMEKTRLNLSVPYILTLTEFVHQAWFYDMYPAKKITELTFDGKSLSKIILMVAKQFLNNSKQQMVRSGSCYSYTSTINTTADNSNWTVKAVFKEPEIVFHIGSNNANNQILLIKMNVQINRTVGADKELSTLSATRIQMVTISNCKRWHSAVILRPCNIEFSNLHEIAEMATVIKFAITSIELQISPTLVHIINAVISDLKNIYKTPSCKGVKNAARHGEMKDAKDLWEIKKISCEKLNEFKENCDEIKIYQKKLKETFIVNLDSLQITCVLDLPEGRLPVLIYKLRFQLEARDWSKQMYLGGEFQTELLCFNNSTLTWEAVLEPVMQSENNYRPCEILFKILRQTACPVACSDIDFLLSSGSHLVVRSQTVSESSSSDDTNSDDAMTIIRKPPTNRFKIIPRHKEYFQSAIDSGSDNENEAMDKLAAAFGHMFSSDSSDDQLSEGERQMDQNTCMSPSDVDSDGYNRSSDGECSLLSSSTMTQKRSCLSRQRSNDSIDSGVEDMSCNFATYVIIDIKDKLDFTVTPNTFRVINEIIELFKSKPALSSSFGSPDSPVQLYNKIGFTSSITIFQNHGEKDKKILTVVTDKDSDYHLSPASTTPDVDLSPVDGFIYDESFTPIVSLSPATSVENLRSFRYEEDVTSFYERLTKDKIQIEIEGFDKLQCYLPERSATRIFALQPPKNSTTYHVSVNVEVHRGYKSVLVSSPLQVRNCLEQAVHLYYVKEILENLELSPISNLKNPFGEYVWLATIQPDDTYHVPLFAAYHCHIFFQPAYLGYQISANSIWWQDLASSRALARFITCPSKTPGKIGYSFKAWEQEIATSKCALGMGRLIPNYRISLHPSVTMYNYLPLALIVTSNSFEKDVTLEPGSFVPIVLIDLLRGQRINLEVIHRDIANYNGVSWKGSVDIHEAMDHNRTICMLGDFPTCIKQQQQRHLYLDLKVVNMETMNIYIYAPYWIVNKTNLPLQFRGSGSSIVYESNVTDDPILFRFKHHRRKRCKTRVYNSCWSVSYSIDNIGNKGLVMCKDTERNKKYKFILSIRLSKTLLTKIITLKPYFMVINLTKYHLRFLETNDKADLWMDIVPHTNLPIWPDAKNMQMRVKIRDSKIVSQPFFINRQDNTVLRMDHGTALCVSVAGGQQSPWMIMFKPYNTGSAPVRVENYCDDIFIKICQKSMCQVTLLSPHESVLYTWDDPTKERAIMWNICNRKKSGFLANINMDGCGQETVSFHTLRSTLLNRQASVLSSRRKSCSARRFNQSSSDDDSDVTENIHQAINKKIRRDKVVVHWVSYMDHNQRVLMFTQDDNVARLAKKKITGSQARLEWCLSINYIGLSLVNDVEEIAYVNISSAPSIWDVEVKHNWKTLPGDLSAWLEVEWKRDQTRAEMKNYVQVDFTKMQMTKPFFGRIRRRYFAGVWCQYRCSEYLSFVNFKIHRLQIDNQLQGASKQTVLYPAPVTPQIVSKFGIHPFIELSFVQRHDPKQTIKIIKYAKALIQEFNVNLETEFLESLSEMFKAMIPSTDESKDGKKQLHKDLSYVQAPTVSSKFIIQSDNQKCYMFEYIHISPIKVNFSFSPQKTFYSTKAVVRGTKTNIFDYLMATISFSLNEMKDVQLRLIYFERKGLKCPPTEMLKNIKNHYISQAIHQSYVYIVGVDIIGNPYVTPRDFTQDLTDQFYEPSLGIMHVAEEYAESTAIELKRILGHYISRSRRPSFLLSGHLEHTSAFLLFSEDYKKKRLKWANTSLFPESMSVASRTLSGGVTMGISGVNVRPAQGAHRLGVEGYLKGIGKSLLGLISKPLGADDDMVSVVLDGIRRAEEMGEDIIARVRLPRFIAVHEGVCPFSPYKAAGQRLVWKLAKGHYAGSDVYWAHAIITDDEQTRVILLTNRHIFELFRNRVWVDWNMLWKVNVDDIMAIPNIMDNRMSIKVRQDKNVNLFPGNEYCIMCDDVAVLQWLKQNIEKVLIANMEYRPFLVEN